MKKYKILLTGALALGLISGARAAPGGADTALVQLVQRHAEAQRDYDQAALREITADNYVEVSPAGEVDERAKMLSFYAADKKRPAPQLKVDDTSVRVLGDSAVVLARLNYTVDAGGQQRSFAMRASYVAQLRDGQWKLVGAQYTAIRPPK
ncbi:nuclear transport factor 2 family protein [Oxalobacteraceae bacterium A2-2]